jgi:hypothetical protein
MLGAKVLIIDATCAGLTIHKSSTWDPSHGLSNFLSQKRRGIGAV